MALSTSVQAALVTALPLPTQTWLRDCVTAPPRASLRPGRGRTVPCGLLQEGWLHGGPPCFPSACSFPSSLCPGIRQSPHPPLSWRMWGDAWHPEVCPLPTSRAAHDLRSPSSLPRLSPGEMEVQGQLAGLDRRAGPHSPGASTCRLWNHSLSPRPMGSGASQPMGALWPAVPRATCLPLSWSWGLVSTHTPGKPSLVAPPSSSAFLAAQLEVFPLDDVMGGGLTQEGPALALTWPHAPLSPPHPSIPRHTFPPCPGSWGHPPAKTCVQRRCPWQSFTL